MLHVAHLLGLALTISISLVVAWWIRRRTRDRAGTAMIVLLLFHAGAAAASGGQLLSASLSGKVFWWHVWGAVSLTAPLVWFVFAAYYTGRERWLTGSVWAFLVSVGVFVIGTVLTNPFHGVLVSGFDLAPDPFPYLVLIDLTSFMVLSTVTLAFMAAAVGLLLLQFLSSRRATRRQTATILVGVGTMVATNLVNVTGVAPLPQFQYGTIGTSAFAVVLAAGLFRSNSFAVAPLARDQLFEDLADAIVVVDANRIVVDFNATAVELFPELEEYLGERLDEAYPEFVDRSTDRATSDDPSGSGGGSRSPFVDRLELSIDGTARTLRISVSEIASGGEPRGYGLIVRDVTELERHAADLEQRTEQLERFASVLSHDLRNPASVATGYAELALETGNLEHIHESLTALERIEETISDLLALTRAGDAIDELEDVSLRWVVRRAWETSDTSAVTLENEVDPAVRVRADPSRLQTMFENLFRNVADHGGETVSVTVLEAADGGVDEGGETGFVVEDDGPGIPADEREQILEYGYTAGGGTGLGLSIVDTIAEAHGWNLRVTDGRWGGARFEVSGVSRAGEVDRTTSYRRSSTDVG